MTLALIIWFVIAIACTAWVAYDLRTRNYKLAKLMQWVWVLTTLYSGPLGLAIYYYSGRSQIARDSLWRRSFRSVAHCYSGCGMGEIIGVTIAVGVLALNNWWSAAVTFSLAYLFGYALTVGPLLQEGVKFTTALTDAFYAETASIVVMEVVAIGVDITLAGDATMGDARFWGALVVSLTAGLLAAYPVNVLLLYFNVKEGMMNPQEMP